jgi:hypothetical protein
MILKRERIALFGVFEEQAKGGARAAENRLFRKKRAD